MCQCLNNYSQYNLFFKVGITAVKSFIRLIPEIFFVHFRHFRCDVGRVNQIRSENVFRKASGCLVVVAVAAVDVAVDVVVVDGVAVAAEAVALDGVTSTVNTFWYFVKHTFPRQKSAKKII